MTLILAAVKPQFAVVAADGSEFLHSAGQPDRIGTTNLQKIFPLPNRSVVLAAHGQNKIHTDEIPCGVPIAMCLTAHMAAMERIPTVRGIADYLHHALAPGFASTFHILRNGGLIAKPLKVVCIGFDVTGGRSLACEVIWRTPMQGGKSEIVSYPPSLLEVIHGGTGEDYARDIISQRGGGDHLRAVAPDSLDAATGYVKQLYVEAFNSQCADKPVFGGSYQCVSVKAKGWRWQELPEGGFAPE